MRRIMSSELHASAMFSSTLSQKGTIFGGGVELKKSASIFWTAFVWTFLTLRRTERDTIKNALGLHVKYRLFLSVFDETWILATYLKKYPDIKFHDNPSSGSPVFPCGRTDAFRHDYILITNLMHWLLLIHKILFSSTCFEPHVLIFRRIQLYTCSIWYCHSLWEFLVACRYSHRQWQYHMLHVHNCILLKMGTWGSKHVEENSILWLNNQCIKLVINI